MLNLSLRHSKAITTQLMIHMKLILECSIVLVLLVFFSKSYLFSGYNPETLLAFSSDMLAGSGDDLTGCSIDESSTDHVDSASLPSIAMGALLLGAGVLVL